MRAIWRSIQDRLCTATVDVSPPRASPAADGVHEYHLVVRKSCILDGSELFVARGLNRLFQHLVYFVQVEITEQRRNHPTLRNPFLPRCLEDHLEKPHHLVILDSL